MASTSSNSSHGLTDQQLKFCLEYAKTLNATDAYKRAGYKVSSEQSAWTASSRLLRNVKVKRYLGEIIDLSTVSVVSEIVKIGMADITDVVSFDNGGIEIIPSEKMSDRGKAAIKSIKSKTRTITRRIGEDVTEIEVIVEWDVALHDRLAALEKLMRKLSLYPKQGNVLELMEALSNHGVLMPGQAEVVSDGIANIQEELRSLPGGSSKTS